MDNQKLSLTSQIRSNKPTYASNQSSSDTARRHADNMASLWSEYRLTEEQFREYMDSQQGCCRICKADFGSEAKRACVDHDHYTQKVRGLLCTQCNTRLGWLERNWPRLLEYLKETK
jgi:hypothetical protein